MKSQNKKIKQRTQFPSMEGCRAAAGWSENARKCYTLVIASHRRWRGNPVNYARTRMRATLL